MVRPICKLLKLEPCIVLALLYIHVLMECSMPTCASCYKNLLKLSPDKVNLLFVSLLAETIHLPARKYSLHVSYQYSNLEEHPWYLCDVQLIQLLLPRLTIPLDILLSKPLNQLAHIVYMLPLCDPNAFHI